MNVPELVVFQAVSNCVSTAGFSVGEYAALVFAGVLSFEDGRYNIRDQSFPGWGFAPLTQSNTCACIKNDDLKKTIVVHVIRIKALYLQSIRS